MSMVKQLNKYLYPCIKDAISEILDKHIISGFGNIENFTPIYESNALDDVLSFLAFNNIQHQYIRIPAPVGADCYELISIVWNEPGEIGHEVWYSHCATKHAYHVSMTVVAETKQEVEDWAATMDGMDIKDWSVEEI